MNKNMLRTLLNDLKAAARLGSPDALDAALGRMMASSQVAANAAFDEIFIHQVILPLADILAAQTVPQSYLLGLRQEPLAAARAMAAAAIGLRFARYGNVDRKVLALFSKDPRPEVRLALAESLQTAPVEHLLPVIKKLMQAKAVYARHTGWLIAGRVAPALASTMFLYLQTQHRDPHPEIQTAMSDVLIALAQSGHARPVLEMLSKWVNESPPNDWLIGKTLAAGWAAQFPGQVEHILQSLETVTGLTRHISNARRALSRHV